MGDYHTVYKGNGETTQWHDLQVKLGNYAPPPEKWKPEKYKPEEEEAKDKEWIDGKDEEELSDLEDEFEDDPVLEEYRQRRLKEMREEAKAPQFGTVEQISGSDYVREITNAGEDVWVVLHLFKDGIPECRLLDACLVELAKKYNKTKFRKIISTECIPKYPDNQLPTVLIYKATKCIKTLATILPFGGRHCNPEQVAFTLNRFGPICRLEGEEHTIEPSVEEVKRYMEKFVLQAVEAREQAEKADDGDGA